MRVHVLDRTAQKTILNKLAHTKTLKNLQIAGLTFVRWHTFLITLCKPPALAFPQCKSDNKKMWRMRIHPFLKDNKDPLDYKPVAIRRGCDVPGCEHLGEYRAPRSRDDVRSFYWFCLDHVREYNQNWDFFKGMSRTEIEHHMYKTAVWDRPTWKSTLAGPFDQTLRQKIYAHFTEGNVFGEFGVNGSEGDEEETTQRAHINLQSIPHPTIEALAVMELSPPVTWPEIKTRYKKLAKKYHPDSNQGDAEAEETFKKISLAYNILKLSYQQIKKED